MAAKSTSFRISEDAKQRLAARAAHDGMSATALLERLIIEGVDALDHPGIVHRGPAHNRRAALAAGPDVWEVVARLRELQGSEEQRIATLARETDLHPRLIRIAIDYAAARPDEVKARIERHQAAAQASRRAAEQRGALLA
ncbi:MAG TPA: hypothetical protein VG452_10485 [Egibacteraceae bacterium]|nr:hypothetical protein [Actinomycetota bacterium]HWB72635.1 hypothetical protein [Egibacteraceae bacterium]